VEGGGRVMCKAKHYTQQLLDIYNNINVEFQNLYNELTEANLRELDLLHIIENTNFNASEGYMYAKMIRDNRIKRRQVKNELNPLSELKRNFISKNMKELKEAHQEVIRRNDILKDLTENKIYNPRVIGKAESKSFDPIPVPSIEKEEKIVTPNNSNKHLSKVIRYKNTNEEIQIINKVDEKRYLVKRKDGRFELMRKTLILNLDELELQAAK
jgi:hypothetical protein